MAVAVAIMAEGEAAHRVNAVLLSEESSLHTSVSNRDVYRLRVTPPHGQHSTRSRSTAIRDMSMCYRSMVWLGTPVFPSG
jgi:hypothetical protein